MLAIDLVSQLLRRLELVSPSFLLALSGLGFGRVFFRGVFDLPLLVDLSSFGISCLPFPASRELDYLIEIVIHVLLV